MLFLSETKQKGVTLLAEIKGKKVSMEAPVVKSRPILGVAFIMARERVATSKGCVRGHRPKVADARR